MSDDAQDNDIEDMNGDRKTSFKYRSDASINMIESIKDMLGNNSYAIEAIRLRNRKLKGLRDIIDHQNIAFKEIEERYDSLSENKLALEKGCKDLAEEYKRLNSEYVILNQHHKTMEKNYIINVSELEIEKRLNYKSFTHKIEVYTNNIGGWRGSLLRLIFTPPVFGYLLITIWTIVLIASFIGWPAIGIFLGPILHFFS